MQPASTQPGEHGLKRELRLTDLVLMQVLLIVGLGWIGSVGVQGSTHVFLWIAGIALLYIPLGLVVIHLSRALPFEGGSYQWIKAGISPFAGYMAAWNNTFYTIFIYGTMGPTWVNSLAYISGPRAKWMIDSTALIVGSNIAVLLVVFAINVRGLHLGKWFTGAGSVLTISLVALIVILLGARLVHGPPPAHAPFSLALPAFSVLTLNVFTKISIGALSGFDSVAVFAGECRRPERDLPLSVMISAPLIAVAYILGTGAMLAYVPPDKIDLAAPLQQLVQAGFGSAGLGGVLTIATVLALLANSVAGAIAMVAMSARFPLVIGWDGLLPAWSTHLHPRYKTPVLSLAAVTAALVFVTLVSSFGASGQVIVQIGSNGAIASLCVLYTLLFAVPLLGKRLPGMHSGIALRLAALSGLAVCLLSLPFQLFPLTGVPNRAAFGAKVGGLVVAVNALGAWLYWRGRQRLRKHSQ